MKQKNPRITQTEIDLIKKAQAGDERAFNTIFRHYKGFVTQILFHYLKDMDEAKDIANIVFLKVHNKLSSFTAYDSFGGWLRIITNRTAIDYLRETKHREHVLGSDDERLASQDVGESAEDELVNRITYEKLLSEFEKFPPIVCKICKLFYENNMTAEQIGKALNIPKGTVKSTLSRTRVKLKNNLKI